MKLELFCTLADNGFGSASSTQLQTMQAVVLINQLYKKEASCFESSQT